MRISRSPARSQFSIVEPLQVSKMSVFKAAKLLQGPIHCSRSQHIDLGFSKQLAAVANIWPWRPILDSMSFDLGQTTNRFVLSFFFLDLSLI